MSNELKSLKSKKHLQKEYTPENLHSTSSESNSQEKKKYINLYICQLSVGIIFTYIFIICSITINIVNRVIFWKYKFKFNFTLVLLQQLFCMIFFTICSQKSQIFIEQTGGVPNIYRTNRRRFFRRFLEIKISIYRILHIFYTKNRYIISRISISYKYSYVC